MRLYPLVAVALCHAAYGGDSLNVGAGKMLNNTNTKVPGFVGSIEYAHTAHLWDVSVRARFMKAERSHLSEWGNSTFESLAVAKDFGKWTVSVGEVVYMNYDTTVEWQGRLYPHGPHYYSKYCWRCGMVETVGYHFPGRFSLEVQYYTVRQMVPTYNGAVVLLKYDIFRRKP